MGELSFPRIVYHQTDGIQTDLGYTYRKALTAEEWDQLKGQGWVLTVPELQQQRQAQWDADPEVKPDPEPTADSQPILPTRKKPGRKPGVKKAA